MFDQRLLFANLVAQLERLSPRRAALGGAMVVLIALAAFALSRMSAVSREHSDVSSQSRKNMTRYTPTQAEWASLTVQQVHERTFRAELVTEGKIAIDEDRSTPVFSPSAGRVTKLLARPGDVVAQGQSLFVIEAPDNVQAQNDFIGASTSLNKARAQLDLAQLQDKRAKDLYEGKAAPLKDFQTAEAALVTAQNDLRSAETALEAARNRLRIVGLSEDAITQFQTKGAINRETIATAPIAGTVVQRKVGPGQYVNAGASDPVFVIGDLSTVWVTAFVRESEAASVDVGQDMTFSVLALPGRTLTARVNYVAAAIDPATRRLMVRATVDNPDGALKPEMFANVTVYSRGDRPAVGVPKQALIYEGNEVRVWVAHEDRTIELRQVKPGLANGDLVEIKSNLAAGEQVVTRGNLFIDRAASGS